MDLKGVDLRKILEMASNNRQHYRGKKQEYERIGFGGCLRRFDKKKRSSGRPHTSLIKAPVILAKT